MQDLMVTLIQTQLIWEDIDANLAMFDDHIDNLKGPTDLIVLPEMFSTGFSMNAARLAETMTGKAVAWLRKKAAQMDLNITGSVMIMESENYYNRLVWARPDGEMITYDKKHLFRYANEDKVFTAGQDLITIELKGWRIRPFICYDLRFPIWTRNLNQAYDMALFVANWPAIRVAHWRALLKARAIENQAYVVGVNRVGTDGKGFNYDGYSAVITPTGEKLFEKAVDTSRPTIRLDRKALEDYRAAFPAWMDADVDMLNRPG